MSTSPTEALPILKQMYTKDDTQLLSDKELKDLYKMVRNGMELGLSKIALKETSSIKPVKTPTHRSKEKASEEAPRKTRSSKSKGKRRTKRRTKRKRIKFSKNARK